MTTAEGQPGAVAGAGEVQRDACPRRHASQCALFGGMELGDAGWKKERGAVNWGRQDGQVRRRL